MTEIVKQYQLLSAGALCLVAALAFFVVRLYLLRFLHKFVERTKGDWDDKLAQSGVLESLAWFAPILILYRGVALFPEYSAIAQRVLSASVLVVAIMLVNRTLDGMLAIYQSYPVSQRRPLKGYVQLLKLFVFLVGAIVAVCLLLNTSPWGILSGIGALTAVLLLVFKDTILSLVASVQIVANDLVRKGDWIEMPSCGVDGDVVDVALHTVKVQNFDKTIVAVPTSKLITDSFKNWRGMSESGGRRIKRSVYIDQSSVRFLTDEEVARLQQVDMIAGYVQERSQEILEHNDSHGFDRSSSPINGRGMTNLGTFRAYVQAYLDKHPRIRKDMTLLVRQLSPDSARGLPMEIYCFTATTNWGEYEDIVADVFDHLLASLPEFGLRTYQRNALADKRT